MYAMLCKHQEHQTPESSVAQQCQFTHNALSLNDNLMGIFWPKYHCQGHLKSTYGWAHGHSAYSLLSIMQVVQTQA